MRRRAVKSGQRREDGFEDAREALERATRAVRGLEQELLHRQASLKLAFRGALGVIHGLVRSASELDRFVEAVEAGRRAAAAAERGEQSLDPVLNHRGAVTPARARQIADGNERQAAGELFRHPLGRRDSPLAGHGWLDEEVLRTYAGQSTYEQAFLDAVSAAYYELDDARTRLDDGRVPTARRRRGRLPSSRRGRAYFVACARFYEKAALAASEFEIATRAVYRGKEAPVFAATPHVEETLRREGRSGSAPPGSDR